MSTDFDVYLTDLAATPLDQHTEHTGRAALETLLKSCAAATASGLHIQHEPRRQGQLGAPDFKVTTSGQVLGYVEVKAVGARLDEVLAGEQIRKYQLLSGNIILTDYLQWIWLRDGRVNGRETLAYRTDLAARSVTARPDRAQAVAALIDGFLSVPPAGIGRAQDLATALAVRARLLRDALTEELVRQEKAHQQGKLFGLLQAFRTQVFHDLALKDFADAFAQTLAYGLFLAKLNAGAGQVVRLDNAQRFIPGAFALIRELVDFLDQLDHPDYDGMRWIVDEILSIVNGLDLAAIHEDLSFRQRKAISRKVRAKDADEHRLFERDPFIYFYEDFLKAYDPAMRKGRGVYYTPPPVVNFIVRAVDDLLKSSFGIADGLADHNRVTVLDFACGTGTFLLEAFQRVFDNIGGAAAGIAPKIVREHLLKNFYGFEYLIAPYTIAHLKLSQYLKDQGHALGTGERLQVYLTNTLEPIDPQANLLVPELSKEAERAQEIKEQPILVVLGNPPYYRFSRNKGRWISDQIEKYKYVDGVHFNERKHWLGDDYVKFIRFAQQKIDAVERGVVAIVTNHAYIDNPTFRGMRQSLWETFDAIYILNLHGNSRRHEVGPGGGKEENVFDIEQGVAIAIFIKGVQDHFVKYGDLWGRQLEKYNYLSTGNVSQLSLGVDCRSPMYFLSPHVPSDFSNWSQIWSVDDIFSYSSVGMLTARDRLTIAFTEREAKAGARHFLSLPVDLARAEFDLGSDTRDWTIDRAKADLTTVNIDTNVRRVAYRPFDARFAVYSGQSRGFIGQPSRPLARATDLKDNLVLVTSNRVEVGDFRHVIAVEALPDGHAVSSKETNHTYPLYVPSALGSGRDDNITSEFRQWLSERYQHLSSPEEIFAFIYAVLHSQTYRDRYAEFLLIDAPRIPFPERLDEFEALSRLGWALVEAHLLRPSLPRAALAAYVGKGDDRVEAVRYDPADATVWISKTQGFRPVPEEVWGFRIGGYQVLDKYLKSRKGRVLSLDEIRHVARICDALSFTIEQMRKIDAAYLVAFPDA
jgi:Type ISP C-terminal specificity domain/N-6 DNA Methylase